MSGAEAPKNSNPTPEQPKPSVQKPTNRPTATPEATTKASAELNKETEDAAAEVFMAATKAFRDQPYEINQLMQSEGAKAERNATEEMIKKINNADKTPTVQLPKAEKAKRDAQILEELSGKADK